MLVKSLNLKLTDINRTIKFVISLNQDKREIYKLLRDEYRAEITIYKKKRAALNNLRRFIIETIIHTNLIFIIDLEIIYKILHVFKKRLVLINRAH